MLNPLNDTDDSIYLKKSAIDGSIAYLAVGIVVVLFFLLTVLGLGRIQKVSDEATSTSRPVAEERSTEIGNTTSGGVSQ